MSKRKKGILILCIIAATLAAVYIIVVFVFQSRFLPRTTINGIECGGKTVEEVQVLFKEETDQYMLTLKERGEQEETIVGTDIGVEIDYAEALNTLLEEQNPFSWPIRVNTSQDSRLEQVAAYDEDALRGVIANLSCMDESKMTDSANASLSEYMEGTGYEMVNAVFGTRINQENLESRIAEAIVNQQPELNLSESGCYVDPQYTEDSDEAKTMLERANKYVNTVVTYQFGSSTEVLDGSLISQWISVGDDLAVTLNSEKEDEYVAALAEKYNTRGKSKSLATSSGKTVTVSAGNYGWKIDQDATKEALNGYLEAGENYTGDVVYSQTAASHDGNDYGNTYVEINLTAQHLWFYKNGSLIVQSDFVSGDVAKGHSTPTGAYRLSYKQKDAVLRGDDYESPVSFWMPFNGGVGLHDASWRSTFGGSIYQNNGSHGCINLPYSAAKTIFNSINAGDPILVYKLPGTERKSNSESGKANETAQSEDLQEEQ